MVLVDTSVWSLALRRRSPEGPYVDELRKLIDEGRACLFGSIRQEILSGIANPEHFSKLRERLADFRDLPVDSVDHERAAELFNTCRSNGVQGSNADFLICAVAERHGLPLLTTDADFALFAQHCNLTLHLPRRS